SQTLLKIIRQKDGLREINLGGCRFVKLIGKQGWQED
ncbi:MAG: protein-L-isoaspartate O-methyltransferase, partial [Deltaproteobacteria bacterium]